VFGGGPVLTANPEPYASFFDVVLLGDGEEMLAEFVDAYSAAIGADAAFSTAGGGGARDGLHGGACMGVCVREGERAGEGPELCNDLGREMKEIERFWCPLQAGLGPMP
jgi:radical SAM superfamily enzyme YgiQ (UPF0313 family)